MSQDPVTITTRTSWFSRLGSAFGGVLTGLALIVAAIALLAWNEGRSVQSIRASNEGVRAVQSVAADRLDPANEGRLIHLTAAAEASSQPRDPDLGLTADGLVLARKVEYYQWVETSRSETRTKLGGGEETVTTYSYDRQWTSVPQDSSSFQQASTHQNPTPSLKAGDFRADRARMGAFTLDESVLAQVPAERALTPTAEQAAAAAAALSRPVQVHDGGLYVGASPAAPAVGDMRVTYVVAPQGMTLSVIGAQTSGTLKPWPTRAGSSLLMVRSGPASPEQMFAQAKAANQTLTWILRGVGVVAMIAAFGMVLAPLGVLADVVPLFGTIVRMGTGLVAGAAGLAVSAVVVAAAWIAYRPLVGVALLAVVAAAVAFLVWRSRRSRPSAVAVGA